MSKLTRAYGAAKLALHAKSPTLLIVGGVVAMAGAAVFACKKTLEVEQVLEPHQTELETFKNDPSPGDEKSIVQLQMARDVAFHYAAPVGIFLLGAGMVFKGHSILQKRNAALAMAFTTLKKSFDNYRARVVSEQGHEADQRFLNGSKETIVNNHGYSQRVLSRDWDESLKDPYNRVFCQETSSKWQNDLGANKHFIACQQRFAQQILNRQGYLYLSEVYDSLGIARSDVSQVCGWKITTLPDGTRNVPVVDFGLDLPIPDDWKYNQERAVFLNFNCQGPIVGGKIQEAIESYVA